MSAAESVTEGLIQMRDRGTARILDGCVSDGKEGLRDVHRKVAGETISMQNQAMLPEPISAPSGHPRLPDAGHHFVNQWTCLGG